MCINGVIDSTIHKHLFFSFQEVIVNPSEQIAIYSNFTEQGIVGNRVKSLLKVKKDCNSLFDIDASHAGLRAVQLL